jgi:LacI family transcriptional regulator
MKPTVKDIAAAAGVSPGTVSNTLNGRKGVSAPVRDKVLEIAREIGYLQEEPPPVSNVIRFVLFKRHGHVVSDTPFFSSLIEGMERECRRAGMELRLTHMNLQDPDHREVADRLCSEPAAGLVVLATEMLEEDLGWFSRVRVPMLMLDNRFRDNPCDAVLIDNADGAWKAVAMLVSMGHTRIGYLHSSYHIRNFRERGRGYTEALMEHGLTDRQGDRMLLEPSLEGAWRDMLAVLASRGGPSGWDLPTAFFADNDIIAAGAVRALQENGLRVPEDVSVVGFDDMPFCEVMSPRLTTLRVFKQEMGSVAVKRLLTRRADAASVHLVTQLETELVLRDSQRERHAQ